MKTSGRGSDGYVGVMCGVDMVMEIGCWMMMNRRIFMSERRSESTGGLAKGRQR